MQDFQHPILRLEQGYLLILLTFIIGISSNYSTFLLKKFFISKTCGGHIIKRYDKCKNVLTTVYKLARSSIKPVPTYRLPQDWELVKLNWSHEG